MAISYKNIVITPNISNTSDPKIVFSGANATVNTDVTLNVYPDSNGTLSFEGSAGQLFSITNDLSNSLFSVSDVSGIPSIEVFANGLVSLVPISGNVAIGNSIFLTTNTTITGLTVGNSTFYSLTDSDGIAAIDITGGFNSSFNSGQMNFSSGVAASQYTAGGVSITGSGASPNNAYLYPASLSVGNSTVYASLSSSNLSIYSTGGSANLTATTLTIGGAVVNSTAHTIGSTFIANTLGVYHTGTVNAASHTVGTSFVANSTGMFVGANVHANTTAFDVGNTIISTTNAIFGGTIAANGSIGSAGQVLTSGGAGNSYWSTVSSGSGTVTSITMGNGIASTQSPLTTSGTLSVNAAYIATISSNNATYLNGIASSGYAKAGGGLGNIDYNAQRNANSGIYSVDATPTNGPPSGAYSNFIQMHERGDTTAQIVVDYATGQLYSRGIQTATPTYSAWRTYLSNTANLNISGGFTVTSFNLGTGSGTVTPSGLNGNYQYITNNGAFTLAAPGADCAIDILITNGASAGAITFSGYTVGSIRGSTLTTTNAARFLLSIRRVNAISTYSIYALQ